MLVSPLLLVDFLSVRVRTKRGLSRLESMYEKYEREREREREEKRRRRRTKKIEKTSKIKNGNELL